MCIHPAVEWREVTCASIDYVREMTAEKFCTFYDDGLFEHLVFSGFFFVVVVVVFFMLGSDM